MTATITQEIIEQLPNFKQATNNEYSSACPFCNDGNDRFRFWPAEGNFWCRQCEQKGFVSTSYIQLDPAALEEFKKREAERETIKTATTLKKIELLNASNNASRYHNQLTPFARDWWYSKGLTDNSINRWQLGYTSNCPTATGHDSFTIPIEYSNQLFNIRHRLYNASNGNKYRPEMTGLPSTIFNADVLLDDTGFVSQVILVEGEIKTMVLQQYGFDAIGIPGANNFKNKWLKFFNTDKLIYVALDPGVEKQGLRIWRMLGHAGIPVKLCTLPVKPDDFFILYGGIPSEFQDYLMQGKQHY